MRNPPRLAAAIVVAILALAGCGTPAGGPSGARMPDKPSGQATQPGDAFPVEITGALGTVTIKEQPKRVATWGWGSTEAAIALGVYPVAVGEQKWTVGAGKLLPWVEAAYDQAGVEKPVILTDSDGGATFPYEQLIAANPDLIVATYSGLTKEQFDTLSQVAPVVAYPKAPWTTSWEDTISITAKALGRTAQAKKVLTDIDQSLATMKAAHPELEGKTIAGVWDGDGSMSIYTGADPRISILTKLGLKVAPSVAALDSSNGGFFYNLSYEQLDKLDADILISYHASAKEAKEFLAKPALRAIPAVKAGRVAQVSDPVTVSSVSPPTALTFDWKDGLPSLLDKLSEAAKK